MRRKDREITDRRVIDAIIRECRVCRLGLCDEGEPYVVPMCFGYDGSAVYFHAALEGRKLDIIRRSDRVCLEWDILRELSEMQPPCRWKTVYQSVIAWGRAEILSTLPEKRRGLDILLSHYGAVGRALPDEAVERTCVIRVVIDRISGKQSAG